MPINTIIIQILMTNSEQTAQLHYAWRQKASDGTPTCGPPMAIYAQGRHIVDRLGWGSPLVQGLTTPRQRNWMGWSRSLGKASLSMLDTLGLMNQEEGLNNQPPTTMGRRHANQVNSTMSIIFPREKENLCRNSQSRSTPRSKGIVTL